MTADILLAALVIVGTLAGSGVGYVLAMRGKRQEWEKEYRERRVLPVVDHVNAHMQLLFELRLMMESQRMLESQCQQSQAKVAELKAKCANGPDEVHSNELREAMEELLQRLKASRAGTQSMIDHLRRLERSVQSNAWVGLAVCGGLDEELARLTTEWLECGTDFTATVSDAQLVQALDLCGRILRRADEFAIGGRRRARPWR